MLGRMVSLMPSRFRTAQFPSSLRHPAKTHVTVCTCTNRRFIRAPQDGGMGNNQPISHGYTRQQSDHVPLGDVRGVRELLASRGAARACAAQ